jgi:hypothetical protein
LVGYTYCEKTNNPITKDDFVEYIMKKGMNLRLMLEGVIFQVSLSIVKVAEYYQVGDVSSIRNDKSRNNKFLSIYRGCCIIMTIIHMIPDLIVRVITSTD